MACALGSIAAEGLWAPPSWGLDTPVSGPLLHVLQLEHSRPVLFFSGRAGPSVGAGALEVSGPVAGRWLHTRLFFDLSYRMAQPERMCPTYTRTSVG